MKQILAKLTLYREFQGEVAWGERERERDTRVSILRKKQKHLNALRVSVGSQS